MISLFAKRDVSAQKRDTYGRWTVGQGNANAARSYAQWKVKERGTAQRLAEEARRYAGKRGEQLRRKVFEANAREFKRAGGEKVRTAAKKLQMLLDLHSRHMSLTVPEEQPKIRASIFAHALQHAEGPVGRLTPAYRDMIRRRVKTALAGEGKSMEAAMTAKKPRTRAVKKFNQEHDDHGRFSGPGGSHDPTGNPRGRPPTADGGKPGIGRTLAMAGISSAGEGAGAYLGATAAGAAGAALGGPPGAFVGGLAGKWAGAIVGGLVGDYVATKIGTSLLGLKEQTDGHGVGEGAAIGALATEATAIGATRLLPGGSALRTLFSPKNFSLAAETAQAVTAGAGGVAGGVVGSHIEGKHADAVEAADRGRSAARTAAKVGRRVAKDMFNSPPKSYDGSFSSMVNPSLPHLFGPRAWKKIAGTPFGNYVRSKVKDAAEKMDDAAEAKGIDLTPAKPQHVNVAQGMGDLAQQHQEAQQIEAEQAAAAQPKPKRPVAKNIFGAPNDNIRPDQRSEGRAANTRFLTRMQEMERKAKTSQLLLAHSGARPENLAQKPGEDELGYRARIRELMAQSVRRAGQLSPQLSPQLSGGEAGNRHIYRVRKKRLVPDPEQGGEWRIEAEIAKGFDTEDTLKEGLVYGWASIIEKDGEVVTDHQNDRIVAEELMKAAHDFVANSRDGGVLHDEYGHAIGHIVESLVFTKELQKHLEIDLKKVGWLIGYKITDARIKPLVKSGLLKAFSIGGRGHRETVEVADAA